MFYTSPPPKSSPLSPAWPFPVGSLTQNRTFIFGSAHISPEVPHVVADAVPSSLFTQRGFLEDLWLRPTLPHHTTGLSSETFDRFLDARSHPPLPAPAQVTWAPRGQPLATSLDFLPPPLQLLFHPPCLLCNCGDISVQHWLPFCPVLWPAQSYSISFGKHPMGFSPNPPSSPNAPSLLGSGWLRASSVMNVRAFPPLPSPLHLPIQGAPSE